MPVPITAAGFPTRASAFPDGLVIDPSTSECAMMLTS